MRLRSFTTFAVAAAATFTAFGCSNESPAGPKSVSAPTTEASSSLLGGLLGGSTTATTITPLLRTTPLASNITVTKTIGVLGGTIAIPGAGVSIVVPPLAVSKNTNFSVTARAGSNVAYDFAPSGLKFLTPLVMTQNLTNTNASSLLNLSLSLGYYPDPSRITSVTELLGVKVDLLKITAVATISHFSGYIFATGRDEE
jgi:hypothetical protein